MVKSSNESVPSLFGERLLTSDSIIHLVRVKCVTCYMHITFTLSSISISPPPVPSLDKSGHHHHGPTTSATGESLAHPLKWELHVNYMQTTSSLHVVVLHCMVTPIYHSFWTVTSCAKL